MRFEPRRRFALAAVTGLFLLATGCSILGIDDNGSERERLADARRLWASHHIDSYDVVLQRLCFCGSILPAKLVVRDGTRISATVIETGEPVDDNVIEYYFTVTEMFDFIEDAIDRKAHTIDVEYDATYGFPRHVSIDYSLNIADEEMGYETSGLQPLLSGSAAPVR
jgi:Family of unknown function (DUF6174)